MTIAQWRSFLEKWSQEWLSTDEKFAARVRKSAWLGNKPATEKQVKQLEKRLGYALPPSYRNFLLTSNGWSRTSHVVERVRPVAKVKWLQDDDPQMLDTMREFDTDERLCGLSHEEYFAYSSGPWYDNAHLQRALIIADPIPGDSMIYLLNPLVVAENGEWEAWRYANWIPGAERFPSFELLMKSERESFRNCEHRPSRSVKGPYKGVYAPNRPRHEAIRLGAGAPLKPRPTIPQLVEQLESPSRATRLAAAKQLFRECKPRSRSEQFPDLVPSLGRIMKSRLETDVRCAATGCLGSFGDDRAIPLLIAALADPEICASVLHALFYFSVEQRDQRVIDAVLELLKKPLGYHELHGVLLILSDVDDARVAMAGLSILDNLEQHFVFPNVETARDYHESEFRMRGAFMFASKSNAPTEELVARLKHSNARVREAAVAAIREDPTRGPHLKKHVQLLLRDGDEGVRRQAEMTIRFLKPLPEVKATREQLKQLEAQIIKLTGRK